MSPRRLRRMMNLWPPFLFSGIRVLAIGEDWRSARVTLHRHWYNKNYVGPHFGGSLFSMTDPYWMLLVMECLGGDYIVWDKAADIEFVAPGREDVFANFLVGESALDEIRTATANGEKYLRWFPIDVKTASGEVIAPRAQATLCAAQEAGLSQANGPRNPFMGEHFVHAHQRSPLKGLLREKVPERCIVIGAVEAATPIWQFPQEPDHGRALRPRASTLAPEGAPTGEGARALHCHWRSRGCNADLAISAGARSRASSSSTGINARP